MHPMTQSILDINNMTLKRNQETILKSISLSIQKSEVLVIIGPSGSGKSSLLRCLNRLESIDSGQILFNGEDIYQLPILELRCQIGMVFQKTAVFDGTVADNIRYGPRLRKQELTHDEVLKLMSQASLPAEMINRDAHELSGGQEQRLSIARALANQPNVLLVDEPTSALDPVITHKLEEILLQLQQENGLTLIWVSHDVEQARRIADRVLMIEDGEIVRCDTVEKLLDPEHGDPHVLAFAQGLSDDQ